MRLTHLNLYRYRNFQELALELPGGLVMFHGHNGAGKSNLLEACYLLATTKSYRASNEKELLNFGAITAGEIPYSRVSGTSLTVTGVQSKVQIDLLWKEPQGADPIGPTLSKRIRINGMPRRAADALGIVSAVLFTAEDINLVTGAPSERRRFIDVLLCQLDPAYLRALQQYQRVMVQRNHLLRQIREGEAQPDELQFWNAQLIRHGAIIMAMRRATLREVSTLADRFYEEVASGREKLQVDYVPSLECDSDNAAELEAALSERLEAVRRQEISAGLSLLGPHRDDVSLLVAGSAAGLFGSRGQSRSVALALRLAESRIIASARGEEPILLLDDMLSELDPPRRRQVLEAASRAQQALLTTADMEGALDPRVRSAPRYLVEAGSVTKEQ